jgi:hypothetical protein
MSENTHHVALVQRDEGGNVQEGIDFWHTPGADTYFYQRWIYRSGKNEFGQQGEFGQVLPDPVLKDPKKVSDLLHTVRECWLEQVDMVFKNPAYPVDTDYR